jgi:hypothetical protein
VLFRSVHTDVLIIDEISMLSDYSFANIEEICRFVRPDKNKVFGGLQIIVCGDFFQLPPVISPEYKKQHPQKNYYCFNSPIWKMSEFITCYLHKNYRQTDPVFIDLLNSIRNGTMQKKHFDILDSLSNNISHYKDSIKLFNKSLGR